MTAQFSAGFPSGASPSALKVAMETSLTNINADICNGLRRAAYEYLADAVAASPPELTTDAQQYAADLELGLRHALYGDIYTKGLNDGDQPQAGKVQQDARDQLLRQYVVRTPHSVKVRWLQLERWVGPPRLGRPSISWEATALKLEPNEVDRKSDANGGSGHGVRDQCDPRVGGEPFDPR